MFLECKIIFVACLYFSYVTPEQLECGWGTAMTLIMRTQRTSVWEMASFPETLGQHWNAGADVLWSPEKANASTVETLVKEAEEEIPTVGFIIGLVVTCVTHISVFWWNWKTRISGVEEGFRICSLAFIFSIFCVKVGVSSRFFILSLMLI